MKRSFWGVLFICFCAASYADVDVKFMESELRDLQSGAVEFKLLGQAKREFLFFDIYDIGSYVDKSWSASDDSLSVKSQNLISSSASKMMLLKYHRELSIDKAKEVLLEGFEKNTNSTEWQLLQEELKAFLGKLNKDVEKGDALELIWDEGNHLILTFNGERNKERKTPLFLRTLWSIWLGDNSVVKREDLFNH